MDATLPSSDLAAQLLPPEVGRSYRHAWPILWKHFWPLLLILVVLTIVESPSFKFNLANLFLHKSIRALGWLGLAWTIFINWPLSYGYFFVNLRAARGEKPALRDLFAVLGNYGNAVLASILHLIIVLVGFALLVVPGIILSARLSFIPFLIVDRKMGAIEAIQTSWRMTLGYTWKILGLLVRGFGIMLLGVLCLVVGVIPAALWCWLAQASLYQAVLHAGAAKPEEAAPIAPA